MIMNVIILLGHTSHVHVVRFLQLQLWHLSLSQGLKQLLLLKKGGGSQKNGSECIISIFFE